MWEHPNKALILYFFFTLLNILQFIVLSLSKSNVYIFYIFYLIIPFLFYVTYYFHNDKKEFYKYNKIIILIFFLPLVIILFFYPYSFYFFSVILSYLNCLFYSFKDIIIFNLLFLFGIFSLSLFHDTIDYVYFGSRLIEYILYNVILIIYNQKMK